MLYNDEEATKTSLLLWSLSFIDTKPWANTPYIEKMVKILFPKVKEYPNILSSFVLTQFVLTPDKKLFLQNPIWDSDKTLPKCNFDLSTISKPKILELIRTWHNQNYRLNICMIDWIDPDFVDLCIELNLQTPKIKRKTAAKFDPNILRQYREERKTQAIEEEIERDEEVDWNALLETEDQSQKNLPETKKSELQDEKPTVNEPSNVNENLEGKEKKEKKKQKEKKEQKEKEEQKEKKEKKVLDSEPIEQGDQKNSQKKESESKSKQKNEQKNEQTQTDEKIADVETKPKNHLHKLENRKTHSGFGASGRQLVRRSGELNLLTEQRGRSSTSLLHRAASKISWRSITQTPLHPNLEYIEVLVGVWKGIGEGSYPTMKNFDYSEELQFSSNSGFTFCLSNPPVSLIFP